MRDFSEIRDAILAELREDYVGLWWVPKHLREDFGISDPDLGLVRPGRSLRSVLRRRVSPLA
jgi:hypothetical protein